ncbi:Inactive serine/threonine-protein kinase [Capsicum chinense]|nr:Inactive serine/threonine-protein kinase [Capsicum chinense]
MEIAEFPSVTSPAIKHSKSKIELSDVYMVTSSLDNRLVLVRFNRCQFNIHRDIAITAQMSHLKNVLKLIGCCIEFEEPVMLYEYVEGKLEVEDRVNGTIGYLPPEEMIYLENLPSNVVGRYIKEDNVMDIADPGISEEHGFEIRQQLEDYLELVKKCTADNRENRPYMIYVARELRRIENCYRALTTG